MSDSTYDLSKVIQSLDESDNTSTDGGNTFTVDSVSTVLLGFNPSRAFIVIQNTDSVLYVKLGTGAAVNNYTFQLAAGAFASIDRWGGVISAIRNNTSGDVIITEIR